MAINEVKVISAVKQMREDGSFSVAVEVEIDDDTDVIPNWKGVIGAKHFIKMNGKTVEEIIEEILVKEVPVYHGKIKDSIQRRKDRESGADKVNQVEVATLKGKPVNMTPKAPGNPNG